MDLFNDLAKILLGSGITFLISYLFQRSKYSLSETRRKRSREVQKRKTWHSRSPASLDSLRDDIAHHRHLTLTWLTTSCAILFAAVFTALLADEATGGTFYIYLSLIALALPSLILLVHQRGKLSTLEAALRECNQAMGYEYDTETAELLTQESLIEDRTKGNTTAKIYQHPYATSLFEDMSKALEADQPEASVRKRTSA